MVISQTGRKRKVLNQHCHFYVKFRYPKGFFNENEAPAQMFHSCYSTHSNLKETETGSSQLPTEPYVIYSLFH